MMRLSAIMATTRGRRVSRKHGKLISFSKIAAAEALEATSVGAYFFSCLSWFAQSKHFLAAMLPDTGLSVPSAAHTERVSSSMIEQRVGSLAAEKTLLRKDYQS